MVNTREHERKVIGIDLKGSIETVEGFTLMDLSQSGALVKSAENLKIGNEYLMNFKLADDHIIPIRSKVVRCTLIGSNKDEKDRHTPLYEVGLQFVNPDKEQLASLSQFIMKKEEELS